MKYLKTFEELVNFELGNMSDFKTWGETEEESLFDDSLFRDINDILDPLSERMGIGVSYDVVEDFLIVRIDFDKRGSEKVILSELLDYYWQLKEYMRENRYVNNKFKLSMENQGDISSRGEKIDDMISELNYKDIVNRAYIEFIKRGK